MTQKLTVKIRLDGALSAAEPSDELGPIDKRRVAVALLVLVLPFLLLAWWSSDAPEADKPVAAPVREIVDAAGMGGKMIPSAKAPGEAALSEAADTGVALARQDSETQSPAGEISVTPPQSSPVEPLSQSGQAVSTSEVISESATSLPAADKEVVSVSPPAPSTDEAPAAQARESAFTAASAGAFAARRFALTPAMVGPEPTEHLGAAIPASDDIRLLYFFTEVEAMKGQSLRHRWYFRDELVADVPLAIGSDRWRTHSSKRIAPFMIGHWRVEAVTADEQVIARHEFAYGDPGEF